MLIFKYFKHYSCTARIFMQNPMNWPNIYLFIYLFITVLTAEIIQLPNELANYGLWI
jgi:hypothetical protein